ncbi:major facilitator superfamily domain-containing protein 6-like [Genypterus blacodes]|uniref:major facilitator superfamily domain-containing protein 6-like n=1 Tax=Genypterus blacodes TaxID=154954 RepID=UPI003F76A507
MKRNEQVNIRSSIALASTFNFLSCCAKGCVLPFLTLYFRQLGLTPAMTGVIMGTKHLIVPVWSPVSSLLSKHYNKRRVLINASLVCSAAIALILVLFPPAKDHIQSSCNMSYLSPTQSPVGYPHSTGGPTVSSTTPGPTVHTAAVSGARITYTESAAVLASNHSTNVTSPSPQLSQLNTSVMVNVMAKTDIHVKNHTTHQPTAGRLKRSWIRSGPEDLQEDEESGQDFLGNLKEMNVQHQLFFLILIFVSIWEFVSAPLEWTADDGLYEYLDSVDASDRHASAGVWGLVGAGCGVGGAGLLVSQLSCVIMGGTHRSAVHFYCYAALALLTLPVASYLPLYLNKKPDKANGLLKAAQLVRHHPRALLCAVTVFLVGTAVSAVDNFLLWQMQDHGSSELHMGLSVAVGLLSQTAFPLFAGRVSKVLSPGRVLTVGAAVFGVQCFYYSFLWGAWAVVPVQLLSCFSSGALWWAVKVHCEDVATPGAEKSVRRIYSALSLELGRSLGSFGGGFAVQQFGLDWLFRGVALGLMVWCVCLPLLQWKAPRQRRINYSRLLAAEASEASDSDSEQERDWLAKAMKDDRSNNNYGQRMNH